MVIFSQDEVRVMSQAEMTEALNDCAEELLQTPHARSKTLTPFDGQCLENNPYAVSLTVEVPKDIYRPDNVYVVTDAGIVFRPWIWRLGTTKAINRYAKFYNRLNSNKFPLDAFLKEKHRVRDRGYKRMQRGRDRATQGEN
jgi:hypothetical protein